MCYYNKSGKEFETSEAGNLTAFTTYFSITGGWYIDRDDRELVKESLGKDMGINGTRWNPKSAVSLGSTLNASKKKPVLDTMVPTIQFFDKCCLIFTSSL